MRRRKSLNFLSSGHSLYDVYLRNVTTVSCGGGRGFYVDFRLFLNMLLGISYFHVPCAYDTTVSCLPNDISYAVP